MYNQIQYIFLLTALHLTASPVLGAQVNALREEATMNFATIIANPFGDNITLTPSGSISGQNSSIFTGTPQPAEFSVQGDSNASASISFGTGDTLSGPGSSMSLINFTHDAGASPAFNNTGDLFFNVGATLTINAGQFGGSYSGFYTVTVDYP